MRHISRFATCVLGAVVVASTASAGGYVAPVAEPVVAPVVPVEPVGDWAGGYAGGSIGYAFAGDDEIGLDLYRGDTLIQRNSDLGEANLKGVTAGLHAGYRWQRDNWVFGPELWVEGGSVDGSDSFPLVGTEAELESSLNYAVGLQFKTGYAVNPQTLVYGTAGAVYGDFDYDLETVAGSESVNYDETGYTLGLGVERKVRDNLSVFAEWQYRNFGKTDVEFGEGANSLVSRATPEHHHVKLGVNFSF
ncbi:outer membrane protein [Paracoccus benzoatiresistens]|uniref:Outer membrane beta-barrel protein n=1 Tax=Paracoccus benzoatiresistens TaxID=2997341 RepID=A0ABT4J4J3_9RHOB|nr:outer membrane beta-barrel protein [Paracoccus sp. EF6]MCZ0962008.1 outer membrane beta-barrel protein [Paracoccus sp. EF6]